MGWNDDLNKINSSLMDFFFPRKCPFCGKTTGKQLLCDTCRDFVDLHAVNFAVLH